MKLDPVERCQCPPIHSTLPRAHTVTGTHHDVNALLTVVCQSVRLCICLCMCLCMTVCVYLDVCAGGRHLQMHVRMCTCVRIEVA